MSISLLDLTAKDDNLSESCIAIKAPHLPEYVFTQPMGFMVFDLMVPL